MKKIMIALLCIFSFTLSSFSQSYKVSWGEEIKLKKGTTDIDIIAADNTGLYFTEGRLKMKSYFVVGASYGTVYKLFKLDKNFNEVFDKDYKKELKGYDFHSFQMLENDLFLFVTDYIKKEKLFKVYAAKIDKASGDLLGDFTEFGSYQLESKRDDYDMKVSSIQNGKAFLTVANISGKERVSLGVSVLDKNLKKKENAVIDIAIEPGRYSLQDVQLTRNNKIVVLGKEFEETTIGKKKKKRLVFKQYTMSIYNDKGRKEKDVDLVSGDKFIIGGKLVESPTGEMLLAGFYSNTSKKDDLNGFFINRVDPEKGELKLSSFKEINSAMLGKSFEDPMEEDDDMKENKKNKQKAKDDDDQEDFPNSFEIKSVDINPADNSIIITSEVSQYSYYSYTTSSYNSSTKSWTYQTNYVHRFTNKDILIINSDKDGNIKWMNDIPKSQLEEIRTSSSRGMGLSFSSDHSGYFASGGGMPYYSSFTRLMTNNTLVILVNDHASNNVIAQYGDKVKTIYNFKKQSNAYGISIDLATGKMSKKMIAQNNTDAILTPRHALVVGNDIYMPSWRMHALAKTELKFAKISVK
jgi:hypothetical protein